MSVSILGDLCESGDHVSCPGGEHVPGVLGGWDCSCECHRAPYAPPAQFIIVAGTNINQPVGTFPTEAAAHEEYRRNQPRGQKYLAPPTIVRLLRPHADQGRVS